MPGTGRKFVADGNTFRVMADSDPTMVGGVFANEAVAHSGGASQKKVRQADAINGITLDLTAREHDLLKAINERGYKYPLAYVDAEGNTYRAVGFINYQGMTMQNNQGTVDAIAGSKGGFVLFEA